MFKMECGETVRIISGGIFSNLDSIQRESVCERAKVRVNLVLMLQVTDDTTSVRTLFMCRYRSKLLVKFLSN